MKHEVDKIIELENYKEKIKEATKPSLNPFIKITKKVPKLLVNHLVTSIRIGGRTKMMLKES